MSKGDGRKSSGAIQMEALILYFVLFFPGIYTSPMTELIPFSMLRELGRTMTYTLPSLALLWYILPDKKGFSVLSKQKPRKKDIFPFITGLPGLIIIGLLISLLVPLFSGIKAPAQVEGPSGIPGWIVVVFSCISTGYLEESYFRHYLLTKIETPVTIRIAISTVLFSFCHMYEGPWGILNAVLAGVLLSVIFIRFRSLHGIAWAHGAYNIFVYLMASLG